MPKLNSAHTGNRLRVVNLDDNDLRLKLIEMGFVNGQELELIYKAPFGDPIAVRVGSYTLSLRLDEAASIEVELLESAST